VAGKQLGTFSKGMQQRLGLAMALIHHPKVVFLDEPTSGLDPFGRMLVRDTIRTARDEGTTVFLNSHLLGEVEATCDRVAFIRQGRVLQAGSMAELSKGRLQVTVRLGSAISAELLMELAHWGGDAQQTTPTEATVRLQGEDQLPEINRWLIGQGLDVYALIPHQLSLEELFLQIMGGATADELAS
jgi:ABC-2 type transport system ATP-binding protein